jgi:hypothetical protein
MNETLELKDLPCPITASVTMVLLEDGNVAMVHSGVRSLPEHRGLLEYGLEMVKQTMVQAIVGGRPQIVPMSPDALRALNGVGRRLP